MVLNFNLRIHGGKVVTHKPPTSEIGVESQCYLKLENLWMLVIVQTFTVQNLDQLYVLNSFVVNT